MGASIVLLHSRVELSGDLAAVSPGISHLESEAQGGCLPSKSLPASSASQVVVGLDITQTRGSRLLLLP